MKNSKDCIIKGSLRYWHHYCDECQCDRGYLRTASKSCRSCGAKKRGRPHKAIEAAANSKRGKPAWNKGLKTNKPAHNRGKYFNNKVKKTLRNRMSGRLRHALYSRQLSKKMQHIFDIVGYSVEDLVRCLESKFTLGMSWDNMGQWHIDHIMPECSFDYSSIKDDNFKTCWGLNNLQPLWAEDNLKKGSKEVCHRPSSK